MVAVLGMQAWIVEMLVPKVQSKVKKDGFDRDRCVVLDFDFGFRMESCTQTQIQVRFQIHILYEVHHQLDDRDRYFQRGFPVDLEAVISSNRLECFEPQSDLPNGYYTRVVRALSFPILARVGVGMEVEMRLVWRVLGSKTGQRMRMEEHCGLEKERRKT